MEIGTNFDIMKFKLEKMGYLGEKWYIMWKFGGKFGNLEKNWKFLHYLEKIGYLEKNWKFKNLEILRKKFGKLEDLVFWRKKI